MDAPALAARTAPAASSPPIATTGWARPHTPLASPSKPTTRSAAPSSASPAPVRSRCGRPATPRPLRTWLEVVGRDTEDEVRGPPGARRAASCSDQIDGGPRLRRSSCPRCRPRTSVGLASAASRSSLTIKRHRLPRGTPARLARSGRSSSTCRRPCSAAEETSDPGPSGRAPTRPRAALTTSSPPAWGQSRIAYNSAIAGLVPRLRGASRSWVAPQRPLRAVLLALACVAVHGRQGPI